MAFFEVLETPKSAQERPESSDLPAENTTKAISVSPEVQNWLKTPSGWIEGLTQSVNELTGQIEPTHLYDYQIKFIDDLRSPLALIHKARQVGMSFTCALKALAKAHILGDYRGIFISTDKDEADEKINFCREAYYTIPARYRKKIVVENKHCLEFESGHTRTRIVSFAQKRPRGKGRNTDVFLDEFAHYLLDQSIWVAALPIILRGSGQGTVLSTSLGMENLFYRMVTKREVYKDFTRQEIMWWECPALCKDVRAAVLEAPALTTHERVDRFGTPKLRVLFANMDFQDFQEEMECVFAGRSDHYIPPLLLARCLFPTESEPDDPDVEDTVGFPIVEKYKSEKFENLLFTETEDLLVAVNAGRIRPNLLFGYDVGHDVNISVLYGFEQIPMGDNVLLITRFIGKLVQETIPNQINFLDKKVMSRFLHARMAIDATGMGVGISDSMEEKYPDRFEGIKITDNWKSDMTPRLKTRLEAQLAAIPNDRETKAHFYSIRRVTGRGGGFIYSAHGSSAGNQANPGRAHHGDIFWAAVLANSLAPQITVSADTAIATEPLTGGPRDRKLAALLELPIVGGEEKRGDRVTNYELDLDGQVKFKDR